MVERDGRQRARQRRGVIHIETAKTDLGNPSQYHEPLPERLQTGLEPCAHRRRPRDQPVALEHLDHLEAHHRRQRVVDVRRVEQEVARVRRLLEFGRGHHRGMNCVDLGKTRLILWAPRAAATL